MKNIKVKVMAIMLVVVMVFTGCATQQSDIKINADGTGKVTVNAEIDEEAYEQATDNFENSPWNDRLYCFHAGLDEFVEEPEDEYDLIISNPPFYSEDYKTDNEKRDLARFQDAMPFEDLIEAADLLLSEFGIFSVIIPYKEEENFIALAAEYELFPFKITHVKGTSTSEIKRSLLAFSRIEKNPIAVDALVIEITRHQYTPEYIALTKDFYLKM